MKKGNKNQKYSRTFLACLLSLCIAVMMAPMAVFADDEAVQADPQGETAVAVDTADETEEVTEDVDGTETEAVEETKVKAVAESKAEAAADEDAAFSGYVLMNIPYSVFYGAETASVADVDSVTSATNKVGNYGKAGGAYHSGTSASVAEDGTVTATGGDTGAIVKGVIWPVKAESIDEVKALGGDEITDESSVVTATVGRGQATSQTLYGYEALTEADAYSYYVLSEAPDYYAVLSGGEITAVQGEAASKDGAAVTVSYGTNWGDVQFALTGVDDASDASTRLVNAVVFTTADGNKVGLYHLDQVWSATEIGWKVAATAGLDGTTITNIRYYCSVKDSDLTDTEAPAYVNYVYDYQVNVDVAEVYTGEVTAEFEDANTIALSGLPEDAENVKAKVYYTTGGRNAKYTYLTPLVVDPADDDIDPTTVDVVDGKITIEAGSVTNSAGTTQTYGNPIGGTTYTVELSSDNYIIHKSYAVHPGYYVLMNIPYSVFYDAEGATVADVDAVTSATNKVGNYGKAGGAYHSGTSASVAEDGTVTATGGDTGAIVEGVIWPVKADSLDEVKALGGTEITDDSSVVTATVGKGKASYQTLYGYETLTEASAYSYYVLASEPDYYMTVDADGKFSATAGEAASVDGASVEVSYSSHWGDVQLAISGIDGANAALVNAVAFTTESGKVGMYHLDQIWAANSIGWFNDVISGLEGETITNIRYYCMVKDGDLTDTEAPAYVNYIYDYPVNVYIKPAYTETVSAEFESSKSITVTGLPEDIENPVATVSSVVGRGQTPVVIADGVAVEDGKIAATSSAVYGTNYSVNVVSNNYADISVTVAAEWSSEAAKAELDEAEAALEAATSDEEKLAAYSALTDAYANYSAALASELSDALVVDISNFAVTLDGVEGYSATYTGSAIEPAVAVAGVDADKYTVKYADNTNAGTATVTITASADGYKGSIVKTFTIAKAANGLTVKASTKTAKYAKVKKAKQTVAPLKASGADGKVTYKKASGSAKLTVNKTTGKVTVKKGTKKGTYKAVIAVTAAGDANHKSVTKKVTVKVKVK